MPRVRRVIGDTEAEPVLSRQLRPRAYDVFAGLEQQGGINSQELQQWNSAIGLCNQIVHDYMNIDMRLVYELITNDRLQLIADFLRKPIPATPN